MELEQCNRCSLSKSRGQVVLPSGPKPCNLMVIGEHPGSDEDLFGTPFEARGGILLKTLMTEAGIDTEEVYFTYMVKCLCDSAPKDSIQKCKTWLWKELQDVKPKVIVLLGGAITSLLLKAKLKDVVGEPQKVDFVDTVIFPWYSEAKLVQSGRVFRAETTDFFKKVKQNV